jgi:hypothetical protein
MATQDFERMHEALLPLVEQIVVERYAHVFNDGSRPNAYRWIKYEDPDPIGRLHWAARRLEKETEASAQLPPARQRLEEALALARTLGYHSD